MSTLLNLRSWVSVEQAADHLSSVFSERVTTADIWMFAVNGKLTLSIAFPNSVLASPCERVELGDIKWKRIPGLSGSDIDIPDVSILTSEFGLKDSNEFCHLQANIPYELPMIGGEIAIVENALWRETGVLREETTSLDGTFIRWHDRYFSLKAPLGGGNFFPAGKLPENSYVVVEPRNLSKFVLELNDRSPGERPLLGRERRTLLNIIHALSLFLDSRGISNAEAIKWLGDEGYGDYDGIKKSTMEQKFSEAKKAFGEQ